MARKRYLIVAMDLGESAPGTVFKTLAKSLYKYADIDILSPTFDDTYSLEGIRKTKLKDYIQLSWQETKDIWNQRKYNPHNQAWVLRNLYSTIKSTSGRKYDGVITFTSMNFFPSISLGRIISQILNLPWSIYSVDGIPSPVEWLEGDNTIHRLLSDHINRSCRKADFIFSSNEYMMRYQQRICVDFKGKWNYLYTPHKQNRNYCKSEHKDYHFLYTGALYGLRRIEGLIAGFRLFLQIHPDSKMIFVGNADMAFFQSATDLIQSRNIILKPFCKDLAPYFQDADVLVDIGADIPDDVFLSSKIISYLPIDRPILALTGANSPARGIMKGCHSIVHCSNQEEDVFQAMQGCIAAIGKGIADRNELLIEFDADTIARKLYDIISDTTH